jgi:GLPGLI family protein
MNKISILTCFMLVASFIGHAQNATMYVYQGKFNSQFGRGEYFREYQGQLIISGDHSLFTMKAEGEHETGLQMQTFDLRPDSMFTVYKNMESNTLLFEYSDLAQRTYLYADTLFPMQWTFMEDQKMIGGIPCLKAVTWFKGRGYTAWYAPSITNMDGPWKLGGLPGLILEAYDDEGHWEMRYVAQMPVADFDKSYFEGKISKGIPGFPAYAQTLKKTLQKLEAAFGGQTSPNCEGCQSSPSLKLFSWEKID